MKHFFISTFLVLVSVVFSFSQEQIQLDYVVREALDFYINNKFVEGGWTNVLTEKDIKGSPYLNDEFINGTIYTIQKMQYNDIPLRYNIYNDNLEFKTQSNEVQELAAPEIVEKAILGDAQMVYLPYSRSNKIKKGFFIILEEGKASVYSKPGILYKEPTQQAAYKEAEPAKFVKKSDEYFVRIGVEPAVLINSKKDLIEVFPDNRDKIEKFIDKNKVKPNKPESLKEVVHYYNSL